MDIDPEEESPFVFSNPNTVEEPAQKVISTETNVFSQQNHPSVFTFSPPSHIQTRSIFNKRDLETVQASAENLQTDKSFKPRLSRNKFQPPVSVFTQALKETENFKQLKRSTKSSSSKCFINNSITCTNVPKSLLCKSAAKQYFLSFGTVAKITIRPKRQVIVVCFATKNDASKAFANAGKGAEQFNIEWTSSTVAASQKVQGKKKRTSSRSTSSSIADDEDLQSELEALSSIPNSMFQVASTSKAVPAKVKKMKPVKETPKKIEKVDLESNVKTASSLIKCATMEELQLIVRQQANNTEDKYRILQARDKLMKFKQTKQIDLSMSMLMIGTCPDMCPEKERLMRESQRQVSLYEQMDGSEYRINHAIAVKQYSRSSADQEEPLPHELRPVRSLKMTMSYLLHEIVRLCEKPGTNLGEWYHFLWDRTRGIRKDITQQELCCPESVELIEQCARFHIVCSERLCAEESSVFDKKINTENLTKCLQTLKYMYHDLRLKGVSCPNEPEFRAYVILLNLNDTNFMWELQDLPGSIQKSPEVKFAIQVYSAVAQNNYCRFFKLVRATTYLNAAILLRYFNQVRTKALTIMIKAYCRTPSTWFDLYELIDILGFEDESEAMYFCEQTGLGIHQDAQDETHIVFNRQKFQIPEANLDQGRAFNVIESKRTKNNISIGECIAGGQMPQQTYLNHTPHTSFDQDGYLLPQSLNATDQTFDYSSDPYEFTENEQMDSSKESIVFSPMKMNEPSVSYQSQSPKVSMTVSLTTEKPDIFGTAYTNPNNNVFANKFANDNESSFNKKQTSDNKIPSFSSPFGHSNQQSIFSTHKPATGQSMFQAPKPSQKFVSVSKPKITIQNQVEETKLAAPPVELKQKSKEELELEEQERARIAEEKRLLEAERLRLQIEKQSTKVYEDISQEVVNELCRSIVRNETNRIQSLIKLSNDVYNTMVVEVVEQVCEMEIEREILMLRTIEEVKGRMKRRSIMKYFNFWKRVVQKRKAQYKALEETPMWIQKRSLEECASALYSPEQDVVVQNMRANKRFKLSEMEKPKHDKTPIEFLAYTAFEEHLRKFKYKRIPALFWKCVISWPEGDSDINSWRHEYNVMNYLKPHGVEQNPIVKKLKPNSYETLYMSLQCCKGIVDDTRLIGKDGLIFVVSELESGQDAERRLSKIFYSGHKSLPIPVVIVIVGRDKRKVQDINMGNFVDAGFVSKVLVLCDDSMNEDRTIKILQVAVPWMIIHKSPLVPLEVNYPKNVLSDCLMEVLWLRIQGHAMNNSQIVDLFVYNPNFIIEIHNEAVGHLINILMDPQTLACPEFPDEFKQFLIPRELPCGYEYCDSEWRNPNYRRKLEEKLKRLVLPKWEFPWPVADVETLSNVVNLYIKKALPDVNYQAVSGAILSNLYLMLESSIKPSFTYILSYIIEQKINNFDHHLRVVYNKDHLKQFQSVPWWFKTDMYLKLQQQSLPALPSNLDQSFEIATNLVEDDAINYTTNIDQLCDETTAENKDDVDEIFLMSRELNNKCEALQSNMQQLEAKMKKALGLL